MGQESGDLNDKLYQESPAAEEAVEPIDRAADNRRRVQSISKKVLSAPISWCYWSIALLLFGVPIAFVQGGWLLGVAHAVMFGFAIVVRRWLVKVDARAVGGFSGLLAAWAASTILAVWFVLGAGAADALFLPFACVVMMLYGAWALNAVLKNASRGFFRPEDGDYLRGLAAAIELEKKTWAQDNRAHRISFGVVAATVALAGGGVFYLSLPKEFPVASLHSQMLDWEGVAVVEENGNKVALSARVQRGVKSELTGELVNATSLEGKDSAGDVFTRSVGYSNNEGAFRGSFSLEEGKKIDCYYPRFDSPIPQTGTMPQRGEYGAIEVRADCNPSSKAYLGSMFWELRALDGENYFCHLEQTRTETGAEESAAICLNIEKGKTLGKKLLMTRVGSTQGDEVEFRGTVQ